MEKLKILLVDDEEDFLFLVKMRLETNRYAVLTVSDPKKVLSTVEAENPDVIILDIVMPDIDGFEISKEIRKKKGSEKTPIIFLTGKSIKQEEISEKCKELKVQGFFRKPVESVKLLEKIDELTGRK